MKGFRAFGIGTSDVLNCFQVSFLLFAARRRARFILECSWHVDGRWKMDQFGHSYSSGKCSDDKYGLRTPRTEIA